MYTGEKRAQTCLRKHEKVTVSDRRRIKFQSRAFVVLPSHVARMKYLSCSESVRVVLTAVSLSELYSLEARGKFLAIVQVTYYSGRVTHV